MLADKLAHFLGANQLTGAGNIGSVPSFRQHRIHGGFNGGGFLRQVEGILEHHGHRKDSGDVYKRQAQIRQIYVNGKKAQDLYCRYLEPVTGRSAVCLPSTSPANASYNLDKLIAAWKVILENQ